MHLHCIQLPRQCIKYAYAAHFFANIQPTILFYTEHANLFTGASIDPATGKLCKITALLKGSEGKEWSHSTTREIDRLVQGLNNGMTSLTPTLYSLYSSQNKQVHKNRNIVMWSQQISPTKLKNSTMDSMRGLYRL